MSRFNNTLYDVFIILIRVYFACRGFCLVAIKPPRSKANPEKSNPRAKPPCPSEIQPAMVGPMIWPAAKMLVKAVIPPTQSEDGILCFTKAVVDATAERKTAPNKTPDPKMLNKIRLLKGMS